MPGKGSKQPPDEPGPESPAPGTKAYRDMIAKALDSTRAMTTEQKVKNGEEGDILTKIEEASVHDMIQAAIRLMNQAGAEGDALRRAKKELEAVINKVEHLSKTGPEDSNLKEFYQNTCFVLKNGSIDDLKKTASFWNETLTRQRIIHGRKVAILAQVSSAGSDWGYDKVLETEKKVRDLNEGNADDFLFKRAKAGLQKAFTGQAELKKAVADMAQQQEEATHRPKRGEHK